MLALVLTLNRNRFPAIRDHEGAGATGCASALRKPAATGAQEATGQGGVAFRPCGLRQHPVDHAAAAAGPLRAVAFLAASGEAEALFRWPIGRYGVHKRLRHLKRRAEPFHMAIDHPAINDISWFGTRTWARQLGSGV